MEAIGSEVGLKMRSAIKAKLMELGCYVDDELPDYVMVMVANKRTRSQMEEDLQLFLSANTEAFVNWLHQVLQKLQEVTVNTKLVSDLKIVKLKQNELSGHVKKEKKKDKSRTKHKIKLKQKKAKKEKSNKKSDKVDETERIRPNVPRLLMNLEKESSPSITDVFAGQILKSHGILTNLQQSSEKLKALSESKEHLEESVKRRLIRNNYPIIDPSTVSQIDDSNNMVKESTTKNQVDSFDIPSINEIKKLNVEAGDKQKDDADKNQKDIKCTDVKKKNSDTAESGSECEDFISLRPEVEDLIDVGLHEETAMKTADVSITSTSPLFSNSKLLETTGKSTKHVKEKIYITPPETDLPQIELNLPKRSVRERLGVREKFSKKIVNMVNPYQQNKFIKLNTNQKEDNNGIGNKARMYIDKITVKTNDHNISSSKNRSVSRIENNRFDEDYSLRKKVGSRVVPLPATECNKNQPSIAVASVVRAPPRPLTQGISAAPQLLLRAMADAHKSILNMPPKIDSEKPIKKKALVLPMRRNIQPQKIIIEVPSSVIPVTKTQDNMQANLDFEIDVDTESLGELETIKEDCTDDIANDNEYVPEPVNKPENVKDVDYIPTHIINIKKKKEIGPSDIEAIPKILNSSDIDNKSHKNPQFVVTLDGLDPNIFLEKKLQMINNDSDNEESVSYENDNNKLNSSQNSLKQRINLTNNSDCTKMDSIKKNLLITIDQKNKSRDIDQNINKSINVLHIDESATKQKIIHLNSNEKLESIDNHNVKVQSESKETDNTRKKRKASPITFNIDDIKISKTIIKQNSDSKDHINPKKKFDSIPPLLSDGNNSSTFAREKCKFFPDCKLSVSCEFFHPISTPVKQNTICKNFPSCTFGDKCIYTHPPCKFDAACMRKDCQYSHMGRIKLRNPAYNKAAPSPTIASHVIPSTNFKTVSSKQLPALCKFYPNCSKYGCNWYHPIPCKYGRNCLNKIECNFYHHDISSLKWKSPHQTQ